MTKLPLALVLAGVASAALAVTFADAQSPPPQPAAAVLAEMQDRTALKPLSAFKAITDRNARGVALFEEAGKVITHPRCANCHPVSSPAQGDTRHVHTPPVQRGVLGEHKEGKGAIGLPCKSCHTAKNVWVGGTHIVTIPGSPAWALAPASQAWQGKSLGDICRQIKDPARNGGKTLAQIHEHMARDALVGWAWDPGAGRTAAPGTQAQFGELIKAWIDSGAACPTGGAVVPSHEPATVPAAD